MIANKKFGPRYVIVLISTVSFLSGCLEQQQSTAALDDPGVATNHSPQVQGNPDSTAMVGENYNFKPTATDPDGDTLTFSIKNRPAWGRFNKDTGKFWGTPRDGDVGDYTGIRITASDGQDAGSVKFNVKVMEEATGSNNTAPTIQGSPDTTVLAGETYSFTPTATDPDDDPVTFRINNMPSWGQFDQDTGSFWGTPSNADAGDYRGIRITATDGEDSDSLSFRIMVVVESVASDNTAPQIQGDPADTVMAGENYSFMPTATDADSDPLTFRIDNMPSWGQFDANTGSFFGTPGDDDAGNYDSIRITVSDGSESSSISFGITVIGGTPDNRAPQIQGSPLNSVKVGDVYRFTPAASDADGDEMSFSIENLPYWAQFDSTTGELSGTPTPGSVGEFSDIRITVSDGMDSSSMSFSISVTSIGVASVTLSWTPPVENEDGTPLTNLAGYYIYYGDTQGNYTNSILIDNPSVNTYVVEDLTPNTYYFIATSFNTQGVESLPSGELEMTAM